MTKIPNNVIRPPKGYEYVTVTNQQLYQLFKSKTDRAR